MIGMMRQLRHRAPRSSHLTLAALGVVFGDIGTSPLYAVNELFFGRVHADRTPESVLGCISLVFWTLTSVICLKYLTFVLRADNDGEGGVFALYSRVHKHKQGPIAILKVVLMLAAGLLFGEGIITPAISVLSAVEGVSLATPVFEHWTVPTTIAILLALFAFQKHGTHSVGRYFGPLALLWFVAIAGFGLLNVCRFPAILQAVNPVHAYRFLFNGSGLFMNLALLGSVMLVITGGEALFADMGHFDLRSIRLGWYAVVYPSLLLNYFGQGAFLLSSAEVLNGNVFYSMIPRALVIPMVVVASVATVIASQALISGAFSLGYQAIALGLFPRLKTIHTHEEHEGQIYIPFVNWAMFFGTVALVVLFGTSSRLAAAYGLSVSGVMLCTSLAMIAIAVEYWRWPKWRAVTLFGGFAFIDGVFLTANTFKFLEGGFIPLLIGFLIFSIMRTWRWGRKATYKAYSQIKTPTIEELIQLRRESTDFIQRNVVLMVPKPVRAITDSTPALVQFFMNRYGLLPKNLFLVEIVHRKVPYIRENRCEYFVFLKDPGKGSVVSATIHFGFMEDPNVELVLEELARAHEIDLPSDPHKWLVHVSHERLLPSRSWTRLQHLRLRLFLLFRQITQPAYYYYGLGSDVNLSLDIMPVRLE